MLFPAGLQILGVLGLARWHPGLAGGAVMARLWLSHDPAGPWVPGWLLPPAVGVGTSAGLFPGSLCKQVSG